MMSSTNSRKRNKRKVSSESDDHHSSEINSVNAYGVRYGPNLTGNASRYRFSRSTNHVMSSNATVNLTRRGFSLRRLSGVNKEDERLRDILQNKWHIYSASPIHFFDSSPEQLARYSKLLNENISAKADEPRRGVTYFSKFYYSPGCPSILSLKLDSSTRKRCKTNHGNDCNVKLAYEGQFFSWDDKRLMGSDDNISSEDSAVLSMPLLLCRSTLGAAFVKSVHSSLVTIFDVVLSSTTLSQEDMAWLTSLASSDPDESQTDKSVAPEVHFFYDLPGASITKCKPSISMSYELDLVHQIWKCVHQHNGVEDEVLYEDVMNFIRSFEEHSLCSYGVNLSECSLVKVVMPYTSFAVEGTIKISSLVVAGRILRFLADMCTLGNTVTPSLGFYVSLRKA